MADCRSLNFFPVLVPLARFVLRAAIKARHYLPDRMRYTDGNRSGGLGFRIPDCGVHVATPCRFSARMRIHFVQVSCTNDVAGSTQEWDCAWQRSLSGFFPTMWYAT